MKTFSCPEAVTPPDFMDAMVNGRYDMAKDDELNQQFFAALKSHLQTMGYRGPLTGEIVSFPYADGKAVYMVADAPRNTCLIHCPLGDAWALPEWQTRGLTKKEVQEQIRSHKALAALFAKKPA